MIRRALLGILLAFLGLPAFAAAQFSIPGFNDQLTLTMTPTIAGPFEHVRFSVEGLVFGGQNTDVAWTVNEKAIEGDDTGAIVVSMGAAGEKTTVTATVGSQTLSSTVIPTTVDLLIDATSYVPPFFKGRPLASPGTMLRLLAIPHFGSAGSTVPNDQITFTWRQSGTVVASGKGRAAVTLPAPPLFGADTISVEARSTDGVHAGIASVRLPGIDPSATLYINHPLVGIEYYRAIESRASVPEVETTFIAVPYFAEAQRPSDAHLVYEWSVNGRAVPEAEGRMNEITINADGSSGEARLGLTLSSSLNFFMRAEQSWDIDFPGSGSALPNALSPSSSDNLFQSGLQ